MNGVLLLAIYFNECFVKLTFYIKMFIRFIVNSKVFVYLNTKILY